MQFHNEQKDLSRGGLGGREREKIKIKFGILNENLNFEKKSFYTLFVPLFLIIAFWVWLKKKIIPNLKTNFYFFDGISENCRKIKENATRWRALDIVYNYYEKEKENIFTDFWLSIKNAQAVRNRLKLTKFLLMKNIKEISKKNREVKLISIASGSAQGTIETIAETKKNGILCKGILIDIDPTALEYARKLSQKLGIENQISFINKTASYVGEIGKEFRPHLIEMVGFLEYRPKEKAIKLIHTIYQALENGGTFLVSQIAPNMERFFLKEVINWPMIYRKPKELVKILSLCGFSLKSCLFYQEPLKIHYIIEAKKYD